VVTVEPAVQLGSPTTWIVTVWAVPGLVSPIGAVAVTQAK
jgi:hypothetical protein